MDAAEIRKHSEALAKALEIKKQAEDLLTNRQLALKQAEAGLDGANAEIERAQKALNDSLKA